MNDNDSHLQMQENYRKLINNFINKNLKKFRRNLNYLFPLIAKNKPRTNRNICSLVTNLVLRVVNHSE